MPYTYTLPQTITDKDNIQVGAINLMVELQIKEGNSILDISSATLKRIIIERPDNTLISGSATFTTTGVDGLIYYYTLAGDLSQAGTYNAQAYIEMPTFIGFTTPVHFTVYENLPLTDIC